MGSLPVRSGGDEQQKTNATFIAPWQIPLSGRGGKELAAQEVIAAVIQILDQTDPVTGKTGASTAGCEIRVRLLLVSGMYLYANFPLGFGVLDLRASSLKRLSLPPRECNLVRSDSCLLQVP